MSTWNHYRVWGVWLVVLATSLAGCGPKEVVNWPELHGRVYDKATGKPLEGAFIVANWEAHWAGTVGGGSSGCIHAEVVRTDAQGGYVIPAWINNAETNRANEQAIHLTVYIPGYKREGDVFTLDEAAAIDFRVEKDDSPASARVEFILTSGPSCVPGDEHERQHMELEMQPVYKAKLIEACTLGPSGENVKRVTWLLENYLDDTHDKEYARERAKEGCSYELD